MQVKLPFLCSTIDRVDALALREYRTLEGQILAMCDLWERTYGIKADELKQKPAEPPKLEIVRQKGELSPEGKARIIAAQKARWEKIRKEKAERIAAEGKPERKPRRKRWSAEARKRQSHILRLAHAKKRLANLSAIEQQKKSPEITSQG